MSGITMDPPVPEVGMHDDDFAQRPAVLREARASFSQANPMLRTGDAWDIAQAIAYLGWDAAGFITGETLNVDGGSRNWGDPRFVGRPEYFELNYAQARLPDHLEEHA